MDEILRRLEREASTGNYEAQTKLEHYQRRIKLLDPLPPNNPADVVKWLIDSMDEIPDAWQLDQHHAVHSSGISLWIANGMSFCKIEAPFTMNFGIIQRWKLWNAIRRLKAAKVAQQLCITSELSR